MPSIVPLQVDESASRSNVPSLRSEESEGADVALDMAGSALAKLFPSLGTRRHGLIAPISALPEELLARILTEAVGVDPGSTTWVFITGESWTRQVEISTVCKAWRTVALDRPAYWAGVRLHLGFAGLMKMLPRWKAFPRRLTMTLNDPDEFTLLPPNSLELLPTIFAPGRIGDFLVLGKHSHYLIALWPSLPENLSSTLHTLRIICEWRHPHTSVTAAPVSSTTFSALIPCFGISLCRAARWTGSPLRSLACWPTSFSGIFAGSNSPI